MTIPLIGKSGKPNVKLSKEECKYLKELYSTTLNFTSLGKTFGIPRITITRILKNGSGSPENIKKIRRKLSKLKATA